MHCIVAKRILIVLVTNSWYSQRLSKFIENLISNVLLFLETTIARSNFSNPFQSLEI
jgi:hypothetical protein